MASSLQPPDHDPLHSSSCSSSSLSVSSTAAHAPRLKLCYLGRAKLFSVSLSQLTFSQLLSLVAQAFPQIVSGHIELSYNDEDGDRVVIDSDESLQLAALSFQESHQNVIKLYIGAHRQHNHIPCRHFQAGSCRYGSACIFLHQATHRRNDLSSDDESASLSDESEIDDEWLMAQLSASEHDNISYLSSPEGYASLMHVLNNSYLPQIVIHQLVCLLTRPLFRTSTKFRPRFLKQATDKIYNALVGSQFLVALPSHICTNVKSVLGCIEPYVFLCEEIVERASNGWKEVPLDELKTLVDKVENDSAGELSRIMAQLLDHRAKKKKSEAVDEQMGVLTLVSNFRNLPIIPI